jgi:hypothetical protein
MASLAGTRHVFHAYHIPFHPGDGRVEFAFVPGQLKPPIDIESCYVQSPGANRGVLDIDGIELIR